MSYLLHAIIAVQHLLEQHVAAFPSLAIVPLFSEMALIPITDELFDEIGGVSEQEGFERLTPALNEWVKSISAAGCVAYVEAEFFGGVGSQSAVVWSKGVRVFQRINDEGSINSALRFLGVTHDAFHDEFEVIGLRRHRETASWLEDAVPKIRV